MSGDLTGLCLCIYIFLCGPSKEYIFPGHHLSPIFHKFQHSMAIWEPRSLRASEPQTVKKKYKALLVPWHLGKRVRNRIRRHIVVFIKL